MLHPDLAICIREFYGQFLEGIDAANRAAATTALNAVPVYVGDYIANTTDPKASERLGPVTLTTDYVISAGQSRVTVTGEGAARTATVPAELGATRKQTIVMLMEKADIKLDDKATIQRIMADFEDAADWAQKIAALPNRASLFVPLAQVPAPAAGSLPSDDVEDLRLVLSHFFTYKADGTPFDKYSSPPPQGRFPKDITPDYINACFVETKLQQGRLYVYAVLPESVWRGAQATTGYFRECVFRFDDQGPTASPRFHMSLLHTAGLYLAPGQATDANPREQIVAFFATQGAGLNVAPSGNGALSPYSAGLVEGVQNSPEALRNAIANVQMAITGSEANPIAHLMAHVAADFPRTPLPAGVEVSGEGPLRAIQCPLAQVVALAERPDIHDLDPAIHASGGMDQASLVTNLPNLYTHLSVTSATGGTGALIGIIDSGVDGRHVAFQKTVGTTTTSRIVAAWDQADTSSTTQNPRARHSTVTAYTGMTYGREYERSATVNMMQQFGGGDHGTHVAGIAGGTPFTTPAGVAWPGGVAQGAEYIVVATGGPGGMSTHVYDGVRYCFQKATEQGKPCVVNISLRTHRHAHDGTDALSAAVNSTMQRLTPAANDPDFTWQEQAEFLPGRVICCAAGNERTQDIHWMTEVSGGQKVKAKFRPEFSGDACTFWAYSRDGSDARLRVTVKSVTKVGSAIARSSAVPPQASHTAVNSNIAALGLRIAIHNGPIRPANGHRNIEVHWNQTSGTYAAREWYIEFKNLGTSKVYIDGFSIYHFGSMWIGGTPIPTGTFRGDGVHNSRKVGSPATAVSTISVASFVSRGAAATVGTLSTFSSPGPLRADRTRQALDVTAPGDAIQSAIVRVTTGGVLQPSDIGSMSGTSMASPFVAGVVACLLGKKPTLTHTQVRDKLRAACDAPTDQPNDWGAGKLNADRIDVT